MSPKKNAWIVVGVLAAIGLAAFAGYGPLLETWYLAKLDSEDADERRSAVEALVERRSMRAVPRLLEMVPEVVEALADGTVRFELSSHKKETMLLGMTVGEIEQSRDCEEVKAIVGIGDRAIKPLARIARSPGPLRARALWLLRRLRAPTVGVFERALTAPAVSVRRNAAWALAALGSEAAPTRSALVRAADDRDADVRSHVGDALSAIVEAELLARGEPTLPSDSSRPHALRGRLFLLPDLTPVTSGTLALQLVTVSRMTRGEQVALDQTGRYETRGLGHLGGRVLATLEGHTEAISWSDGIRSGVRHFFVRPLAPERRGFVVGPGGRTCEGWLTINPEDPLRMRRRRVGKDGTWLYDGLDLGTQPCRFDRRSVLWGDRKLAHGATDAITVGIDSVEPLHVYFGGTLRVRLESGRIHPDSHDAEVWVRVRGASSGAVREWNCFWTSCDERELIAVDLPTDGVLDICARCGDPEWGEDSFAFATIPLSSETRTVAVDLEFVAPIRTQIVVVDQDGRAVRDVKGAYEIGEFALGIGVAQPPWRVVPAREVASIAVSSSGAGDAGHYSLSRYPSTAIPVTIVSRRGGAFLAAEELVRITTGSKVRVGPRGFLVGRVSSPGGELPRVGGVQMRIALGDDGVVVAQTAADGSFCFPIGSREIESIEFSFTKRYKTVDYTPGSFVNVDLDDFELWSQ